MATLDKLTTILDFKTDLSSLRQAEAATNRARGRLDDLSTSATRTGRSIGGMGAAFRGLGPILATVGAGLVAHKLKDYADTWTLVGNRVALYTSSAKETQQVQQRLFQISQSTRSSLEATATLYQRVAMANDSLNVSQDRLLGFTETLNQAFIVSGASAQEARNAVIQFSQGLASGELRGEEFRSVTEQGTRVIQALATQLGVTRGELREMAHTGKLTSDVVFKAIEQDAVNISAEFAKLTPTIGQAFTVLDTSLTGAVGRFAEASGAANFFAEAITGIAGAIDAVTTSGARQDDQLTAAQRRRQARQRQDAAAVPSIGAGRGTPPPGLTATQRRRWQRGQFQANFIEGGFTDVGDAVTSIRTPTGAFDGFGGGSNLMGLNVGTGPSGGQAYVNIRRQREARAAAIAAGRDFLRRGPSVDRGGLFASVGATGGQFGQSGVGQYLKSFEDELDQSLDGLADGLLADFGKTFDKAKVDFLGFNVTVDQAGFNVGLAGVETQRWSQGLADLGQVLVNTAADTSKFAGAAISIVQGAATGGPLGALAAGFSSLIPIFQRSTEAARAAARAERERYLALLESRGEVTGGILARARERFDPAFEQRRFAPVFQELVGVLQGLGGNILGEGGALSQLQNALGTLELFQRGEVSREQLGSIAGNIMRLLPDLNLTSSGITAAQLGQLFIDSPFFSSLFGQGGSTDLSAPLPVGPVPTPTSQAALEAAAAFGGPPIEVMVERVVIEVSGAGDPAAVADEVSRKFQDQFRAVVEAVDTKVKA